MHVLSCESTAYDVAHSFSELIEDTQIYRAFGRLPFRVRMIDADLGAVGGPPRLRLAFLQARQQGLGASTSQHLSTPEPSRRRALNTIQG